MSPTVQPGDRVLVDTGGEAEVSVGDLVVAVDPADPTRHLLKRVTSRGRMTYALSSDNPFGARDSRQFGSVSRDEIVGRVTTVIGPNGRYL